MQKLLRYFSKKEILTMLKYCNEQAYHIFVGIQSTIFVFEPMEIIELPLIKKLNE